MRRVAIGVIVIGVIVVGLLATTALIPVSTTKTGWDIYHEKDGQPVYAIMGPGGEVDTLNIRVWWEAIGSGVDADSFMVVGSVDIFLFQALPGAEKTLLESFAIGPYSGANKMVSETTASLKLATMLADYMEYQTVGWNVVIEGELTGVIKTDSGEELTYPWSDTYTIKYEWVEGGDATFTFVAGFD